MSEQLSSRASLLGRLGPWGPFKSGKLTLTNGYLTFTQDDSAPDPLFRAPVGQVRVRFPWLYFGLGVQLTVEGRRHRIWFLSMRSAAGDQTMDGQTIVVGNTMDAAELGRARRTTRTWRSALADRGA